MNFATVCSGIEACSVAWEPLGWNSVFYSEIEKFPNAVLAHHYPDVPNHGDMTMFKEWPDVGANIDVLCAGTPCQAFSVAGLRKGLDDPRGNLTLTFLGIVEQYLPRWVVWENVPGVLSIDGGRPFGSILAGLAKLGYGVAYAVLDAQYVRVKGFSGAVPQRRRRVFVVGHIGGYWQRAAAVLFERESLSGNHPPCRETGKKVAANTAHSLRADGFDASEDGTGRGTPIVPEVLSTLTESGGHARPGDNAQSANQLIPETAWALQERDHKGPDSDTKVGHLIPFYENSRGDVRDLGEATNALTCGGGKPGQGYQAIAFSNVSDGSSVRNASDVTDPITCRHGDPGSVVRGMHVRRLTPVECERLQGFPDGYTKVPYRGKPADKCPDGPRYKALGNSMAVNVMRWIGIRIQEVDCLLNADTERG